MPSPASTSRVPERWRTGDLDCSRLRQNDLDALRALFSRPELLASRPPDSASDPDPVAAMLAGDLAHWAREGIGRWAVRHQGTLVGLCGLTRKPGFGGFNISYYLAARHWGRGWATELARGLVGLAPTADGASRVYGLLLPGNPASRRVLEKAGFRLHGPVDYAGRQAELWLYPAGPDVPGSRQRLTIG